MQPHEPSPADPSLPLLARLIAGSLVQGRAPYDAAALLSRIGMPRSEIARVLSAVAIDDGSPQRETIERLVDLGFDLSAIIEMTGYSKASVPSVVSRYKKTKS